MQVARLTYVLSLLVGIAACGTSDKFTGVGPESSNGDQSPQTPTVAAPGGGSSTTSPAPGLPSTGPVEPGNAGTTAPPPPMPPLDNGNSPSGGAGGNQEMPVEPDPVAPNPGDPNSLTAQRAAAQMGQGFNLGQMFDNTQHPRTFAAAQAKIDAYYERGFRNVRIPITWTEAVGGDTLVLDPLVGNINREHPRLQVITEVIDYALSLPGLFVVINAHHEDDLKTHARGNVLEQLWTDITDIFGDRDPRLMFEFLNEPHKDDLTPMAPAEVRRLTGLAYDRVRAVNTERIVIIGGNQWFGASEVPAVWTSLDEVGGGSDPFVMATFHHYNPWEFCGNNQGTYDDPWTDAHLADPMDTMKDWADTVGGGMPVYIGEWGVGWGSVFDSMECNNIRLWFQRFDRENAAPRGQPTAVWDDGGWFRLFNHGSNSFEHNLIDCLATGECDWQGSDRFNDGCR